MDCDNAISSDGEDLPDNGDGDNDEGVPAGSSLSQLTVKSDQQPNSATTSTNNMLRAVDNNNNIMHGTSATNILHTTKYSTQPLASVFMMRFPWFPNNIDTSQHQQQQIQGSFIEHLKIPEAGAVDPSSDVKAMGKS